MDIHIVGKVSVEDTRQAHLADLAVQEKYGVTYHQYWFNEKAGTVFCLMEAPDKESCEATHLEANGLKACQIVEVEGGMYDIFLGNDHTLDHGMVRHKDGEIDTGFRFILTINVLVKPELSDSLGYKCLKLPHDLKEEALATIKRFGGKDTGTSGFEYIIAVFKDTSKVLHCACEIRQEFLKSPLLKKYENLNFNMGISFGQPLTEKEGFFTKAIQLSHRLCLIARDKEIITSKLFKEHSGVDEKVISQMGLRTLKAYEQNFINDLVDAIEENISSEHFGVDFLGRVLGMSQPQLYRKIYALTGRSPVTFIKDIRLNRALSLIQENNFNLSQVALEIGYNSPSYFSKCFQEKFGAKPSKIKI